MATTRENGHYESVAISGASASNRFSIGSLFDTGYVLVYCPALTAFATATQWTLQGSFDGQTWFTLATGTGEASGTDFTSRIWDHRVANMRLRVGVLANDADAGDSFTIALHNNESRDRFVGR